MMKRYHVPSIVALFFLFHSLLIAGTTGKISGRITDSKSKEGIPSAIVKVVGTNLGAATDIDGNYVIANIPPGTYSVTISYVGYQPVRVNDVGVSVDFTYTLNVDMKETSVELNEFVVEGERNPLIRQDQTNPVVAITSENIQSLPVTSVSEIVGLQAGVVVDDNGGLHVRGGRSNEISYTLNGISVNDPYNNQSSIGVATNAVQEVSVSTGTFNAEYGNALSGVVNYVTKEGGKNFSGSIRELTGDYYSTHEDVYPHLKAFQPFNTSRTEATLGGPTFLDDLTFYASGVYARNNGYLYGNRIYNPTDMFITRDEFTKKYPVLDGNGDPFPDPNNPGYPLYFSDPRYNSNNLSPYYFNPIGNKVGYTDYGAVQLPDNVDMVGLPSGDSALVPLNTSQSFNIQGNLTYHITSTIKLKYEAVFDKGQSQSPYYYSYRFNPDGRPTSYSNGLVQELDWTHTLNSATFYTVKLSSTVSEGKTYTYSDINDPRYLPGFYQTTLPIVGFYTGGTYLGRTWRKTTTYGAKVDLQTQLFGDHEVKVGGELRMHTVQREDYDLQFYAVNDPSHATIFDFQQVYSSGYKYAAKIPDVANGYVSYTKKPKQLSLYVQDKIELEKSLILNAGLRYEYFDPDSKYNPNISAALAARDETFLVKDLTAASAKTTLSPRLSIAYPITDQGVIRFSYGHFYQIGNLGDSRSDTYPTALYTNSSFSTAGTEPKFGNANVKPQRSIQYEIGLQQGFTPDLRLEVVGFYKDVKDYIFSQLVLTAKGDLKYFLLTNLDYANSRGLTISLFQRRAPGSIFSASLDYTFAIAEGNRTSPREDFFFNEAAGKTTETFLVPLSFDRRHVLNATINLSQSKNYVFSTIIRLQSGTPYTPGIPASLSTQLSQFIQNSATKPFQWRVDLKAEKFFEIGSLTYSLYAQVDNLFDRENQTSVYSNSGLALYNANQVADPTQFQEIMNRINRGDPGLIPESAVTNYYINPSNISSPRLIRFGFSIMF